MGPEYFAVHRDITDVVTLGHWLNHAQKHHFMRREDGQTPYQAWDASCRWIESNLQDFARSLSKGKGHERLEKLGNACHALEDSFSQSHVSRVPFAAGDPGMITHVHIYSNQRGSEHSHADEQWKHDGWVVDLAKDAVIDMVDFVFTEVASAGTGGLQQLKGWSAYRDQWLKPSPTLQRQGAHNVDLIDAHSHHTALDEKGLGTSLYSELGKDTAKVLRVFSRLAKHDNTNADDVARYYTRALKRNRSSAATRAVAQDSALVALLIRVMSEGIRSPADEKGIAFLRQLR